MKQKHRRSTPSPIGEHKSNGHNDGTGRRVDPTLVKHAEHDPGGSDPVDPPHAGNPSPQVGGTRAPDKSL